MSQIASAYLANDELLGNLNAASQNSNYREFWAILKSQGEEIKPAFDYSGYMLSVLLEYLQENQVDLQSASKLQDNSGNPIKLESMGLALSTDSATAKIILEKIAALDSSADELENYFQEFTGEAEEVAEPMMEALEYLKRTLNTASQTNGSRMLLFIG